MTAQEDWFGLEDVPSVADVAWLNEQEESRNGSVPHAEEDSWTPQNLAKLADTPPVEPTLGGLGLVYPGKRHVFSGPQESAKTLAAYVIGLQVVRAGSRVVLIDFEMGPWDAKGRLRELGATMAELAEIDYIEPDVAASESVIQRVVETAPALVIIDAIAGAFELHGLDDNKRQDVERFSRLWLQPFRRAGIATIALDHVTKNADTRGTYAIGSERKVGGADVHLGFTVVKPIKRGSTGTYKITTHKDRGGFLKRGKLAEFELASDPDTSLITWAFRTPSEADDEHPFRPTHLMEKVSGWLERQSEAMPMGHIEEAIDGARDYVRLAIQILVDEGYVIETPGPRKARLMESARPYSERLDDLSATSPDLSGEVASSDLSTSPLPLQGRRGEGRGGDVPERSSQKSIRDEDEFPF